MRKTLKVLLSLVLVTALAVFVAACNKDTGEKVKITYAAWDLGTVENMNLERKMVQEFTLKYPNIEVQIVERPKIPDPNNPENQVDQNWDDFLGAKASAQNLPDVFMHAEILKTVEMGWAEDVKDLVAADDEFDKISPDLLNSTLFDGALYGIPLKAYYFGYYVNNKIFEDAGVEAPKAGISFDDLLAKAQAVSETSTDGTGISGMRVGPDMQFWYPAYLNNDLGYYTWDGTQYNLDSTEYKNALTKRASIFTGTNSAYYSDVATSEFLQENYGVDNEFAAWDAGKQAIRWEASWMIGEWLTHQNDPDKGLYQADIDFIGMPGDKQMMVVDYLVIGKGTEHPEEALLFAKWMGFGIDGYTRRLELVEENDNYNINFTPIVNDQTLLDKYLVKYPTLVEFRKVIATSDIMFESLAKTVPGYVLSRWNGQYGQLGNETATIGQAHDMLRDGLVNFDDIAEQLNERANFFYTQAKEQLLD